MKRSLTVLCFSVFAVSATATTSAEWQNVPLYSAQSSQSGLSQSDRKVISRMGGGTEVDTTIGELMKDEIWARQDDVNDALFKALGETSIDFDLFESGRFEAEMEITPRRRVYFENQAPKVQTINGKAVATIDSNKPSRFIVVNSLTTKVKTDVTITDELANGDSNFGLNLDAGIQITYLTRQPSPRELSDASYVPEALQGLTLRGKGDKAKSSGALAKMAAEAGRLLDRAEASIKRQADKVIDEDSAEIFFNGLFDPARLIGVLPVRSAELQSKMKIGDIIAVTIFTAGGPELSYKDGVWRASIEKYYRAAYHIAMLRKSEHEFLVRPMVVVRRGWDVTPIEAEVKLDIGIARIGLTPLLYRIDKGRQMAVETVMEFDLREEAGRQALDGAVGFKLDQVKAMVSGKVPGATVSERAVEKLKEFHSRIRFNVGFAQYFRERRSEISQRIVAKPDGSKETTWSGATRAASLTKLRLPGFRYDVFNGSETMIKSNIDSLGDVLEADSVSDRQLSRQNMTYFGDRAMSRSDYKAIETFVGLATGDANALSESVRAELRRAFESRETLPLTVLLLTRVPGEVIAKAFSLTEDQFYEVLASTLLEDPNQPLMQTRGDMKRTLRLTNADDRRKMELFAGEGFLKNCVVRSGVNAKVQDGSVISCRQVWSLANAVGRAFSRAKAAKNDQKRLESLVQVETYLGVNPLMNLVILNAARKADPSSEPEVEFYVAVDPGPGLNIYSNANSDRLSKKSFVKNRLLDGIIEIPASERRIRDGQVYTARTPGRVDQPFYVSIVSPVKLQPDQRVSLWLQEFKRLRRDTPVSAAVARNLVAEEIAADAVESYFRYEIEVPAEMMSDAAKYEKSELQVRIENSNGQALSEFGRFQIRSNRLGEAPPAQD